MVDSVLLPSAVYVDGLHGARRAASQFIFVPTAGRDRQSGLQHVMVRSFCVGGVPGWHRIEVHDHEIGVRSWISHKAQAWSRPPSSRNGDEGVNSESQGTIAQSPAPKITQVWI